MIKMESIEEIYDLDYEISDADLGIDDGYGDLREQYGSNFDTINGCYDILEGLSIVVSPKNSAIDIFYKVYERLCILLNENKEIKDIPDYRKKTETLKDLAGMVMAGKVSEPEKLKHAHLGARQSIRGHSGESQKYPRFIFSEKSLGIDEPETRTM